jgi:hypothetical protein
MEVTEQDWDRMHEAVLEGSPLHPISDKVEVHEKKCRNAVGHLKLKKDKTCILLGQNGLCRLHVEHGEISLPTICSTFPRRINRIEGLLELSGQSSCPQIARLLLLGENSVDRVKASRSLIKRFPGTQEATRYKGYLNVLRGIALWLLERPFPLEHRLHFLLELAQRTQPYLYKGLDEDISSQLEESVNPLLKEPYLHRTHVQLLRLNSDGISGLQIILQMMQIRAENMLVGHSHRFKELVHDILPPTHEPSISVQRIVNSHAHRRMILKKCLGERIDRYATRLAINHWFGSLFSSSADIMIYLQRLLMIHGVCRVLLIHHSSVLEAIEEYERDGDYPKLEETVDGIAVRILYNTSRALDHSSAFDKIQEAIKDDDGTLTQHLCFV